MKAEDVSAGHFGNESRLVVAHVLCKRAIVGLGTRRLAVCCWIL